MKWKKMIAPIIITILMMIYYIVYFGAIIYLIESPLAILLGIVPLLLGGAMIYVCYQRIKEIRSGEEDDLSKY